MAARYQRAREIDRRGNAENSLITFVRDIIHVVDEDKPSLLDERAVGQNKIISRGRFGSITRRCLSNQG
jgi:hypothetical protein